MPPEELDATAASSSATDTGASSAGTENTDQSVTATDQTASTQKEPPFHQHPRFQQLIGENRQLKSAYAQVMQKLQALETRAASNGGAAPNAEYVEAAEAILKIFDAHPKLKSLLTLGDKSADLLKGLDGVERLSQAQQTGLVRQGRGAIREMAKSANLATDDDTVAFIEDAVTGLIQRTPGALERFRDGDLSTVEEAFQKLQSGVLAQLRRTSAATLAETKDKTKRLPPAPRGGGLPGAEPPPKLEPGKEREFESGLHQRALKRLAELTQG